MIHRPFYSLNEYYREFFGEKAYKISINAGLGCPNRDNLTGLGGCIFCSRGGSGDFASDMRLSITEQIDEAIEKIRPKYTGSCFIAYFQAYTNTFASVEVLRSLYMEAVLDERIHGLSIATRPDCLEPEKIALIQSISRIKPVWIELGFQTSNENTARLIRRGYDNSVFVDAVSRLNDAGLPVVVHLIAGLPGETFNDMLESAVYLSHLKISGVKLQLLHVLKDTDLADMYAKGLFSELSLDEYSDIIVKMIAKLPPDVVIHRITGDGPRTLLIAPKWSLNKKNVLNTVMKKFKTLDTYQGKEYS